MQMIIRLFQVIFRGVKGFVEDECYAKASSLSFYTLLSIVPILAVAFGLAKGFGFEKTLETEIVASFYQHQQIAEQLIAFARSTLEQAQGSLIAGVGVLLVFWSSLGLLGNLEQAFNTIWKFRASRSIPKRIRDYLPILILTPMFIVASSSLTFFMISKVVELTVTNGVYEPLKPFIHLSYYLLLLLLVWGFYSFIYIYIPNKKVPWGSCFLGGFAAACVFQILQWSYIHVQVFLTSYNAIYGSFAAIPLFLLWLQISWLITLGGAELAYQHASLPFLIRGKGQLMAPIGMRGLRLMTVLTAYRSFWARKPLKGSLELAKALKIPHNLASDLVEDCVNKGLLLKAMNPQGQQQFVPAADPSHLTLSEIVDETDDNKFQVAKSDDYLVVLHALEQLDKAHRSLSQNYPIERLLTTDETALHL